MNSIEVYNLSKKYVINHQSKNRPQTLRELLTLPWNRKEQVSEVVESEQDKETFWALKDVSFSVGEGERIAIIGGNGAGKSTLLKILSRITDPTTGTVTIRGKVSSLLEVGTGFHPELTGRENIYLNGAILGMKRREIATKFDQIVAFSGVEKFIDTPVKQYSSGMYVRLAFSVSAWLDPDILIIDEVLSVGDQAFQRRCAERMKELTEAGRTVLFVSHSMQAVKAMCKKALILEKGRVISFESVEDAASQYLRSIELEDGEVWHKDHFNPETDVVPVHGLNTEHLTCLEASIINRQGERVSILDINASYKIVLRYKIFNQLAFDAIPNFHFIDEFGVRVFVAYAESTSPRNPGTYQVECELSPYVLNTGRYSVMLMMSTFPGGNEYFHHFSFESALCFEITERNYCDERRHGWQGAVPGVTRQRLNWTYLAR